MTLQLQAVGYPSKDGSAATCKETVALSAMEKNQKNSKSYQFGTSNHSRTWRGVRRSTSLLDKR
jgi:hypothetical protein